MEAISCGTPMLAANAQGYAMYLTHGVNAAWMDEFSLLKPLDPALKAKRES